MNKFETGMRVKILTKSEINKLKDKLNSFDFVDDMYLYCGKKAVIIKAYTTTYSLNVDNGHWTWYSNMIKPIPLTEAEMNETNARLSRAHLSNGTTVELWNDKPTTKGVRGVLRRYVQKQYSDTATITSIEYRVCGIEVK